MASTADLTKFSDAIRKLSELSGKDLRGVVTAEAGKVLSTAVRYTPKADRAKIKAQVEARTKADFERRKSDVGQVHTNKKDGKQWFSPGREALKWYLIHDWKVPAKIWKAYQRVVSLDGRDYLKTLRRRLREALGRRGLTAKTWVQIGRAIGAKVDAPGFVEKAPAPERIGTGHVTTDTSQCSVYGENESLALIRTRTGQGIVDRALRARAKYAETAIRKGALSSMESRARAYPEIFKDAA